MVFGGSSQAVWDITPTSLASMRAVLPDRVNTTGIEVTMTWELQRNSLDTQPPGVSPQVSGMNTVVLLGQNASDFIDVLDGVAGASVLLQDLMPSFTYLGNSIDTEKMRKSLPPGEVFQRYVDFTLSLDQGTGDDTSKLWWSLQQVSAYVDGFPAGGGPTVITLSARVYVCMCGTCLCAWHVCEHTHVSNNFESLPGSASMLLCICW
eukprot:m.1598935 g.1598935  ORF g.1598935 m.1598935 type:complete len:207 (+) comp25345_c0_seq38:6785-7405(+)